jgi:N-methylhydantoinase A
VGGLPVRTPSFDIETIGAGGGSIASVDPSGRLRVGPESAGADPGPAAYGRGGTQPTVTDALVALGLIDPGYFLGGDIPLDAERARTALRERLARPLGTSVEGAAHGILTLVNHHMARALRLVSVERGYDPRRFTLVAYGGAGPLHAAWLARQIGIPRVFVPASPGLQSAAGLLWADLRCDRVAHLRHRLSGNGAGPAFLRQAGDLYRRLEAQCRALLKADRFTADAVRLRRSADLRYEGQAHEISVRWDEDGRPPRGSAGAADRLAARFHRAHQQAYGHAAPDEPVEVVALRVAAEASVPRPARAGAPRRGRRKTAAARRPQPDAQRPVCLDPKRGFRRVDVYRRERLAPGMSLIGPALIEGKDANVLLLAGQRLRVLGDASLEMGA